ncbi:MAG: hypothetical protein MHPSP_004704, partial [Paramarteilia canceri]
MLIAAPTGSGKTISAIICISREISKHINSDLTLKDKNFKIIYLAPMKSLATEITSALGKSFPMIDTLECTGDTLPSLSDVQRCQLIIATPEKWDVITRKNMGEKDSSLLTKLIIIDE